MRARWVRRVLAVRGRVRSRVGWRGAGQHPSPAPDLRARSGVREVRPIWPRVACGLRNSVRARPRSIARAFRSRRRRVIVSGSRLSIVVLFVLLATGAAFGRIAQEARTSNEDRTPFEARARIETTDGMQGNGVGGRTS